MAAKSANRKRSSRTKTVATAKFLRPSQPLNLKQVLVVVGVVAVVLGLIIIWVSRAATDTTSEVETWTADNVQGVVQLTDPSASGGKAVQFVGPSAASKATTAGSYVIYTSNSGTATQQIWRMKIDGTEPTRITNDTEREHHWPRASPDGKLVLYYKANKGAGVNDAGSNELWMMNSDGTNQHLVLTKAKYNWTLMGHGEWSPDSSRIVQAVGLPTFTTQLITIKPDGTDPVQITQPTKIDGVDSLALDPSWPQANTIVYIRQWNCFFVCGNQDVHRLDLATKAETRITNSPGLKWDPYMTPDGKNYVWLRWNGPPDHADLYRGNVTGDLNPTPIIADGGLNSNGIISNDSKRVLFLKNEGAVQKVYQINLDGTGLTRITRDTTGAGEGLPSYWP